MLLYPYKKNVKTRKIIKWINKCMTTERYIIYYWRRRAGASEERIMNQICKLFVCLNLELGHLFICSCILSKSSNWIKSRDKTCIETKVCVNQFKSEWVIKYTRISKEKIRMPQMCPDFDYFEDTFARSHYFTQRKLASSYQYGH